MCAYLMSTRSSQPHRLFLPVVTPTSFPRVCSSSPISLRQQVQTVRQHQFVFCKCPRSFSSFYITFCKRWPNESATHTENIQPLKIGLCIQASVSVISRCHKQIHWPYQMKFTTAGFWWQCSKTSSGWCCLKTKLIKSSHHVLTVKIRWISHEWVDSMRCGWTSFFSPQCSLFHNLSCYD